MSSFPDLKNIAIIDIKEYNRLRDFEEKIKNDKDNEYVIMFNSHQSVTLISKSEAIEKVVKINKELLDRYEQISEEYRKIKNFYIDKKDDIEFEITSKVEKRFKEMSVWDFKKWKKNNK